MTRIISLSETTDPTAVADQVLLYSKDVVGVTQLFVRLSDGTIAQLGAAGSGMAIGGTITSATAGSVLFAGAAGILQQDNANLFWDDTNNRLGIGIATPSVSLDVVGNTKLGTADTTTVAISGTTTFGSVTSATRYLTVDAQGLTTTRYDSASLFRSLVLTNRGITATGHGAGVSFALAAGGAAAVIGATIDVTSENSTFTGATADGILSFKVAGNGTLNESMRMHTTGGAQMYIDLSAGLLKIGAGIGVGSLYFVTDGNSRINSGYEVASTVTLDINYTGYQGGTTQVRHTTIWDGQNNPIAEFTANTRITLWEDVDVRGNLSRFGNVPDVYINGGVNAHYNDDLDNQGLFINNTGYNNGTTRFRSLFVQDGKGVTYATFDGPTHALTVTANSTADAATISYAGTAQTSRRDGLNAGNAGTYDTTSVSIISGGIQAYNYATRSAGANNLENWGLEVDCSGGQVNYAIVTQSGDNWFNRVGGQSLFSGRVELSSTPTAGPVKYGSLNARLFLGRQRFTAGGTYTPAVGTKAVRLRFVGGGGGGAGTAGLASSIDVGGGGGSGTYAEVWLDAATNITGGSVTIGAAGAAGASGGGAGGTGGDSTILISGTTFTAKGGIGGNQTGTGSTNRQGSGGTTVSGTGSNGSGTFASIAMDYESGNDGEYATRYSLSFAISGSGGSNPLGTGGARVEAGNQTGGTGRGYGAGGAGSLSTNVNQPGAPGTAATVIIDEYA